MFSEQHTPDQVTTYEVAREILGRHLGQALAKARAADDPTEEARYRAEVSELEGRRQRLRVGSEEATQIVEQATTARAAALADG